MRIPIRVDGTQLQCVKRLEYLGVMISTDERVDGKVRNRITKENRIYWHINNVLTGKKY